jgi:hypothetical protein
MGNHYLTDVDHGSHCLPRHRTASLTYMSDESCEGAQLQGYMWECMCLQETQRVWTATNFLRRSGGPSEDVLHSSATNAEDFRVLQTSHSPLKIGDKTLSLSISTKKCTVVEWHGRLQAAIDLTSHHSGFFELFQRALMFLGSQFCNFGT